MKFSQKAQLCDPSPMRKFHPYAVEAEKRGVHIYHLNIGQPDIETPAAYFEAIRDFQQSVLSYAPSPGIPELIDAVRAYYSRMGIHYDASDVLITTGGSEALMIAMMCLLDPGDEIIVPEPFYPNYNTYIRAAGGVIRPLTTRPEEGYFFADREKIEALINDKTRAIVCTNPGNPTGVVLSGEEMRMIADVAREHDLFVISDEVYREFMYDGTPLTSFGEFDDVAQNTIIIDSVSKRFSACGARIGALISKNPTFIEHALKFCQARLSVATLDQVASAALYAVDDRYFIAMNEEYKRRRDTIYRKLCEIPGVICTEPQGAFYMMAKLPVDNTDTFQKWLLTDFSDNNETLMYAPGESFYATPGHGRDEVRLAYVLNCRDLERAMELLKLAIARYRAQQ